MPAVHISVGGALFAEAVDLPSYQDRVPIAVHFFAAGHAVATGCRNIVRCRPQSRSWLLIDLRVGWARLPTPSTFPIAVL